MSDRSSSASGSVSPGRRCSYAGVKCPFMIGVAGGTASGKSSVCEKIVGDLGQKEVENVHRQVLHITQDSFYRELNAEEIVLAQKGMFNFDHPDAFDIPLMETTLQEIQSGRPTKVPVYDFKTNSRVPGEFTPIYTADVVIFEGILTFYYPGVRDMFHMKLFVDTDADTRLARRVLRDIQDRGRNIDHVLHQYITLVKPAFEEFCIPTKKFADVIIPRGVENTVAIKLIVQHIQDILDTNNGTKTNSGSPFARSRSNSDTLLR